ncbi:hypothetical protein [Streptosporangium carneum]|uniref:Uncharacterized protein n=1 Tax=Streptosporangium carneum TaxID=47481 RepID=A0A9W6MBF1_9ACTN|nr:hypothetical protein [Streptosporangium carneum]GLK07750.1 hypothetical protein GCM10017600_11550 [Streptosporangium carneum]
MIVIPVLAGSLLLAVGCGTEHSATAPGAAGAGVTVPSLSVSHTVAPKVEPTGKGAPRPVKPEGHTNNPRKVTWLSAKPSKDGRSLRVVWWSGVEPCHVLDRVSVKQTAKRVTVTLWEGESSKVQNVACIDIAVQKVTTVKLKAPLGKRKVVDGAR